MSGHNRWSKVKRIKGPADAKRGKLFTKLLKEIMVAARVGGGNPDGNPRLRQAIQLAKDASMPKDNIERAVKKGTGELEGDEVEELVYEGYGPGGVAVLVEAQTDNKNRTVNDLRQMFKASGGNLGEPGSVAWMFDQVGQIIFEKEKYPEDKVMEVALEVGAKDVAEAGDTVDVFTEKDQIFKVKEGFERVGMHPVSAGFGFIPKSTVPIDGESAEKLLAFLDEVEDHDDVQKVHANFQMSDDLFAKLTNK
jgi:YebC/PmpR family DNA-binding regulatory protein